MGVLHICGHSYELNNKLLIIYDELRLGQTPKHFQEGRSGMSRVLKLFRLWAQSQWALSFS